MAGRIKSLLLDLGVAGEFPNKKLKSTINSIRGIKINKNKRFEKKRSNNKLETVYILMRVNLSKNLVTCS